MHGSIGRVNDGGMSWDGVRRGEGGGEGTGGQGNIGDNGPHAGDGGRDEGGHGRHGSQLGEKSDLCTRRSSVADSISVS